MTLTLQGQVERVTYENEETGFRVVRLGQVTGGPGHPRVTVVGIMPPLGPGISVRVSGRIETHKQHGERVVAESVVVVEPDSLSSLEKYLGSGILPGVGESLAKRIVKFFGLQTLRVLDNEPHRLGEVPGLGPSKVARIREAWIEQQASSNTMLVLKEHGVSPALARKIVARFGARSAETVQRHPYRLALAVAGVGFVTADKIARARGLPLDHPERAQAGLYHQLVLARDQGHCLVDRQLLIQRAAEMLSVPEDRVEPALDQLWASEHVVVERDAVYLRGIHDAEVRLAQRVGALVDKSAPPLRDWAARLARFEYEAGFSLGAAQREAVERAAYCNFLIITGGPGVGKTTLVRALLAALEEPKSRIRLAAPTGRAAQRLSDSTGRQASTLHRLLEVGHLGGRFGKNADQPIECDVLVVDECSMLDIHLADALFEAIPPMARVILVGDADQLPSVGPGAVLLDLIQSGKVPVVRLSEVFRQGRQSGIVDNSHAILQGREPQGCPDQNGDFFLTRVRGAERAVELVRGLVKDRMPEHFGLDPMRDIQVLCPMHRGAAGTVHLNQTLQSALNPGGSGIRSGDVEFRRGDKVLQLKNDYENDVFNGDVGVVVETNLDDDLLRVQFEGEDGPRVVEYQRAQLGQLGLAYCMSVHKSQGSEYPAVVLLLLSSHFMMLSRNLLYTAVTRAKRVCVVITDDRALQLALAETRRELRATGLCARIRGHRDDRIVNES